MKTNRNITVPRGALAEFCRRHRIGKLSFFGSVLRDDFRPDSDVDVLIEFEPGHTPGLFRLSDMSKELSALLGGRRVDLRTPQDLSPYFREEVIASAEVGYGQE
ncbi:MAG TPA: nucleotidyltransferase family protein [Pyrinomonadaceae bacterium]|nr:nucleotidyltransferase family protein [Pyrinomonadaceae bacterium]